ncbi:hypothetical protein PHLGIDRAFT_101658 [Phlebiopsis gigantea 11061_1 CR5-6]|uniref:Thioredoxin n=1 Tax=Phlebiopsis gigantea (strain 11061_1 CR5-6) TaxID=745531 RepID=A0A0C3NXD2_PHLG1|nr:hypothetical protein PHLGIDRAFT_101658 [Phlebiopsis gigantea 11061_1 CR5-6]
MSITTITSLSQLNDILTKAEGKLAVIDFHATWCGPCKMIAPVYEGLSQKYKNVKFLKCDVDAVNEVASRYGVRAMPTFVFIKGKTQVDKVEGADRAKLEATVRKHASGSSTTAGAFSGKGHTLGGTTTSSTPSLPDIPNVKTWYSGLDPQAKVLLGLVGAYFVFWILS